MNATDKIERFLRERKRPVTVRQLADYFLIQETTVGQALKRLEQRHVARSTRAGRRKLWTAARSVAVPANIVGTPPRNYPHVRGYDD